MSEKHTPGPWVHNPEDNIITTPNGFCKLLEWQARSMHVPQEERDANARLIAAAPELLEALQKVVAFWDSITMEDCVNDIHVEARAALLRATGEPK